MDSSTDSAIGPTSFTASQSASLRTASQSSESGDRTAHDASRELLPHLAARRFEEYLAKARKNEEGATGGNDPEAIHDLRVAIRRIRTALALLEDAPGFDPAELRALRKGLRPLAKALGKARDLDLMLVNLDEFATLEGGIDRGLGLVRDALASRRADAQDAIRRVLARRKTHQALSGVERLAKHEEKEAKAKSADRHAASRLALPITVRAYAGGAIWRNYGPILGFERALPAPTLDQWHRLRIASKQMRYTLEFFSDALGPDVEPLIATLTRVQDYLGALQDARMRNETLHALARQKLTTANSHRGGHADHRHSSPTPTTSGATSPDADHILPPGEASNYVAAQVDERDHLEASALDYWHTIANEPFRRELARLVAAL